MDEAPHRGKRSLEDGGHRLVVEILVIAEVDRGPLAARQPGERSIDIAEPLVAQHGFERCRAVVRPVDEERERIEAAAPAETGVTEACSKKIAVRSIWIYFTI